MGNPAKFREPVESVIDAETPATRFGRYWSTISVAITMLFCTSTLFAASSLEQETQTALETLVSGHKANDLGKRERGVKMLELAARRGSGDASFSLASYYSGVLSPDFPIDKTKQCYWVGIATSQKHIEAYWSAAACAMANVPQNRKAAMFEQQALPWVRKILVESTDQEDVALARRTLQEWDDAKRAQQPINLSGVLAALGQIPVSDDSSSSTKSTSSTKHGTASIEKAFVCTVYCNSASGPTIRREITASSRSDAAKAVGDMADQLCRDGGHAKASALTLQERQCRSR